MMVDEIKSEKVQKNKQRWRNDVIQTGVFDYL